MSLNPRKCMVIVASFLFAAPVFASGYGYPLQSPEIRDAFFLGQRDDGATGNFLLPYGQRITQQQTGEFTVTEVDLLTPYVQIIQRGAKDISGDSQVQVETDLRTHPLPFIVQVTAVYNFNRDGGLIIPHGPQRDFSVELKQAQTLAPRGMTKSGLGGKHCPCGVMLSVEFDPSKITSAPMHITVHTPDGRSISADFDMSKLK